MGSDSEPEIIATVAGERCGEIDLRRVSRARRSMPGERRLQVGGARQSRTDQRAELLLLRRRRRAHLLADEERLLSTILAIRHLQGLPQRLQEESQIDSEPVREDTRKIEGRAWREDAGEQQILINQSF